jgi:septum formation protein
MKKDFVFLASASPRRSQLLSQIGVRFEVRVAAIDEQRAPGESPADYVVRVASAKADKIWAETEDLPVLAADTAVVVGDQVLGKPRDARDAERMLELLSDRSHQVLTGVALRYGVVIDSRLSASEVRFRATTAAERRAYCDSGEPLDKAGGYGIQGIAAIFIQHMSGS